LLEKNSEVSQLINKKQAKRNKAAFSNKKPCQKNSKTPQASKPLDLTLSTHLKILTILNHHRSRLLCSK
jgi:hypothetical protein